MQKMGRKKKRDRKNPVRSKDKKVLTVAILQLIVMLIQTLIQLLDE